MKKVAILIQNLHNGGAERMASNLSLRLSKEYQLYLIVFDGKDAIYPYGGSMVRLYVPPMEKASVARRIINVIRRVRKLKYYKKKLKIDITISHLDNANLINILSKRKDRVISVYHSIASREAGTGTASRLFQRYIAKHSEKYICVSKPAVEDLAENFHIDRGRLDCIYNFIDTEAIRREMTAAIPKKDSAFLRAHEKLIVHMGRLIPLKGQYRLLYALSALRKEGKDVGLVILGEGEKREELTVLAEKLGLEEHLLMPGELANPFPYVSRSDVFALCSDYEGLPMVLIEAMACGCPAVSCDMRSGAREILAPDTDVNLVAEGIEYAKYGILTKPFPAWAMPEDQENGREEAVRAQGMLTEAIRLMLYDEELRQSYLSVCEEAVDRFSPETILPKWRALIEDGAE